MAASSAESLPTVINLEADLLLLLDNISKLATEPPSLYMALEGIDVGRHGSVSILTLHLAPTQKTYLIDILSLGARAFSATNESSTSLKTILESTTVLKVVFDIRNVSDALFSLFQISVGGIKDLQLMELACRVGSQKFVSSLAQCVEKSSPISASAKTEWRLVKERHHTPFLGRCAGLNGRPLRPEIVQYCQQKVCLLPGLYEVYNAKLRRPGEAFWRVHVRHKTLERIKLSQSLGYDGKSKNNSLGWDKEAIEECMESWNDEILMEHLAGTHVLDENDEWVAAPQDDFDDLLIEEDEDEDDRYWDDNDTARDCIGWEEDMIKNGEYF